MLVEHVQPHTPEMSPSTLCLMDSEICSNSNIFIQFLMAIVHVSKYEYRQRVWRAREKRCSKRKGLPLGGYNTGILHDEVFVVFS